MLYNLTLTTPYFSSISILENPKILGNTEKSSLMQSAS